MSMFEDRRRAPAHHWARAENARYSAFLLSSVRTAEAGEAAKTTGYRGTPAIAIEEAYQREAALALELIVKAVIAMRIQVHKQCGGCTRVPAIHNVPKLWAIARLPVLEIPDRYRLLLAAQLLQWSSRYAAPREDKKWEQEVEAWRELEALEDGGVRKRLRIRAPLGFEWNDVNRLFSIADDEYWRLEQECGPR